LSYYLLARTFLYKSFQFPCLHSFKHPINFFSEGELTRRRAIHVNNNVLADVAVNIAAPAMSAGVVHQRRLGAIFNKPTRVQLSAMPMGISLSSCECSKK
jgi:hypothetical protein